MKTILLFITITVSSACNSQEIAIGLGYKYLHSKQYDQLIQTYNFSRPHLLEKQPLLESGIGVNGSYLFKSDKKLRAGITLDYALFSSTAINTNHEVTIALNMVEIGYLLKFSNKEKFGNFYGEISLNAVIGMMNKKVDDVPYVEDDSRVNSFQVGTCLNSRLGYTISPNDKFQFSPFIGFNYAPYFSEGKSEVVINQTNGLILEQYNSFFNLSAGMRIHLTR